MFARWSTMFLMVAFAAGVFANLSGCSKERVYESVYEGVRMQNEADRHPEEKDPEKMPGYDKYQRDRQGIIEDSKTK